MQRSSRLNQSIHSFVNRKKKRVFCLKTIITKTKKASDASDTVLETCAKNESENISLQKKIFQTFVGSSKMASDTSDTSDGGGMMLGRGENSFTASDNLKEQSSSASEYIPDSIYRAYGDTWKCKNPGCNAKGDKWYMLKHPEHCRKNGK
jgi:hypothetical protein